MRSSIIATTIPSLLALAACSDNAPANEEVETEQSVETHEPEESVTPGSESVASPQEAAPEPVPSSVADGIKAERVSFAAGANSAFVEGSITGYESIDYVLNVREGQPMNISMATQHTATYFNLLEPGESVVATHIGSTAGNQFEGVAAKSGDYRVRVYMMRSAARRDEKADYRLEMIVG